ncbi:MAG: hypothetical protein LAT81_15140 [Oceanicaulis sp.]|nr:hypothetical protein [Oceanicaulis sp.]
MKDRLEIKGYFTDKELIKILCHKRAIIAKKGHDDHFFRNISPKAISPHKHLDKEIFSFFPPRSKWIRLTKRERAIRGSNTVDTNAVQLERTIWREVKRCERLGIVQPCWLKKLLAFTEKIREDVFDESRNFKISSPRVIPVIKDIKEKTYRPISVFELNDLIITRQMARYLSNCFDPLFSDSSYAFRTGIQKDKVFNHHKAIEDIIEFKRKVGKPLFVAECDIKKFYDCINHSKITEKFNEIIIEAKEKLGIAIDNRAVFFFNSYLAAFSFNDDIKKNEKKLLSKVGAISGTIPWVKDSELLDINSDPKTERIGVPQGGAISCLIANILLTHVDRTVNANSDGNTFYGRFCDDMVLMHTEKEKCESLLETYQTALKEVKLISHKPLPFKEYGKAFWDDSLKSKLPYKWAINYRTKEHSKRNVPWLSFVGYQIRYDGVVRVRNKSIKKELKKQVAETDKIINVARKTPRINRMAIKFRLQQRLISMSVSRFKFGSSKMSMCWCAGFKVLKSNPNLTNQIRRLDRNREKQLRRLELYLKDIKTPVRKTKKEVTPLKYYGHNYSYHKQFV